jgi:FkbM family methyltransferase
MRIARGGEIGKGELGLLHVASWLISAIPAGSGRGKLGNFLYRRALAGCPPRETVVRLRGGARFRLDISDRLQAEAFLTRAYEPRLLRFLGRRLSDGGVFLDVGAHVGLVSICVAASCRRRDVRVHAFEPDPLNAAAFRENLRLNPGFEVTLNEVAVGQRPGTAVLERSSTTTDRALGRIVEAEAGGMTAAEDGILEVPVFTLDDYISAQGIEHVEVLKLDVEGYEPAALAGAERFLRQGRIGCVVCEMNEERLKANGWTPRTIHDALSRHGFQPIAIPAVGLRRIIPRARQPVEDVAFARGFAAQAERDWDESRARVH